tara:strand:- start:1177 stop:1572 length:396 start_codon:yes stop_codon:yes gene_type:complete
MKKILLLLIIVSLIGCGQNNEEYINNVIKDTKANISLPYEGELATWSDIINENDRNLVFVYYTHVQNKSVLDKLLVDYETDHASIIRSYKSDPLAKGLYERNINLIFRYYNKDQRNLLLLENVITPTDWGF